MSKAFWISAGLLLSGCCSQHVAERSPNTASLQQLIESQAHENAPGLAVTVLEGGRVAFESTRGLANLDSKVPISPDTQFYIASLSKQFTAMAIAILEDRGLLTFDEPLGAILGDLPPHLRGITLDELLRHTSGLPAYMDDPSRPQTNEEVLRWLRRNKELLFPPGTEFRYSNTGYTLLASCVETVSGQPFPDFMKKEIFAPLGMTNTLVCTSLRELATNRAIGYCTNDGTFAICDSYPPDQAADVTNPKTNYGLRTFGDTGVFTTLNDIKKWCRALETHLLLKPAKQEQLFTPAVLSGGQVNNYGRGWFVSETPSGKCLEHAGQFAGFRARIVWFPDLKLWIVLLGNRTDLNLHLPQQILDSLGVRR